MELHVGGLCCRPGCNKRKQTAGFFSERPKKESENISHVAIPLENTAISVQADALLPEASGGRLTGQVLSSKRSFQ